VWGTGPLQALRQLPQLTLGVCKEADGPVAVVAPLTQKRLEPAHAQVAGTTKTSKTMKDRQHGAVCCVFCSPAGIPGSVLVCMPV
jgi:hypothetical protein